jgi:hypothetical protein
LELSQPWRTQDWAISKKGEKVGDYYKVEGFKEKPDAKNS